MVEELFRIVGKMRYPGALSRIKFFLNKGVSAPDGDPASACVFQETGTFIAGRTCK